MKQNVGSQDRIIRIVLAIVLILLYAFGVTKGVFGVITLVLSGILLITALMKRCPMYCPLKINTTKKCGSEDQCDCGNSSK